MSQVYLCANPANFGVLCLWCSSATRGIAAGKLLHQHPCLPHAHHPNTGLLHGDGTFFSPSLPHTYSCCKDVTPYHVWHRVMGNRTEGHTAFARILCVHRITEDFTLRLPGNKPVGKSQMEKRVWWPDSRNPVQKYEGKNPSAQYQNSADLRHLVC